MDVLWPSNGALPFFRDDLDHYPASAFVMDAIGLSPPGSGLHLTAVSTTPLPNASFRVRPQAPLVSVPTTLVILNVAYQDPLTAPITKAPGSYKWTNTVKPARRAVKSLNTQWVVLSGLKKHGGYYLSFQGLKVAGEREGVLQAVADRIVPLTE